MTNSAMVYVVDDDPSVRVALQRLVRSLGYEVKTFESAEDFLDMGPTVEPSCLVLDIRMPGLDGLELQERLAEIENDIPIIFITGNGTIQDGVRAIKNGAVDLLEKPFNKHDLSNSISASIEKSVSSRHDRDELNELLDRVSILTPREYEVFQLAVQGMLNKQIALKLEISISTVNAHRARVMEKMQVEFFAQLVHLAAKLGVPAR